MSVSTHFHEGWLCLTLLQLELLYTSLVGGDGGALDTNGVLLDGLGGINGNLVVGLITVFKTLVSVRVDSRKTLQNCLMLFQAHVPNRSI